MNLDQLQEKIYIEASKLGQVLASKKIISCTAESCTGGLISGAITEISGSSGWFDRAFITYTNEAKHEMLDVRCETIDKYGAVSEETVREMSLGAIKNSKASLAVAVSGIAGPTGGSIDKPVGTVWLSWAVKDKVEQTFKASFQGDRKAVRLQTVLLALTQMRLIAEKQN